MTAHLVLLGEVAGHRLEVGGLHGVHLVAGEHRFKPRLLQCPAQDLRHVVAAGIVAISILVAKSFRDRVIGKYSRHLTQRNSNGAEILPWRKSSPSNRRAVRLKLKLPIEWTSSSSMPKISPSSSPENTLPSSGRVSKSIRNLFIPAGYTKIENLARRDHGSESYHGKNPVNINSIRV